VKSLACIFSFVLAAFTAVAHFPGATLGVPGPELFCPMISDARGNLLVVNDARHGGVVWNKSRPTGYGSVPGYRPPAVGHGASLVESCAWAGRPMLAFGGQVIGHRVVFADSGQWASADQAGHEASDNLFSYCGGDPINFADVNGLCAQQLSVYDRIDAASDARNAAWHRADLENDRENLWTSMQRQGEAVAASEYQSAHLRDLISSGANMNWGDWQRSDFGVSYVDKWKYDPAGMFEKTLKQGAELSLMALPMPGVGLAAAAGERAILSDATATFLARSVRAEIGMAERRSLCAAESSSGLVRYLEGPSGLRGAAQTVHEAVGSQFGVNQTTVAIAKARLANGEITYFASGSGGALRPTQRELLARFGVPEANQFFGAGVTKGFSALENHAEQIILRNLPEGASVEKWGISWSGLQKPIPCPNCAPLVNAVGGWLQY